MSKTPGGLVDNYPSIPDVDDLNKIRKQKTQNTQTLTDNLIEGKGTSALNTSLNQQKISEPSIAGEFVTLKKQNTFQLKYKKNNKSSLSPNNRSHSKNSRKEH